ncbi:MAG: hydrogenase, partial [Gammaproteobacteria bacterium]|nr:hydrogenase [Gammaproteobacteria bacterium]
SFIELPAENIIRAIGQKAIIPNGGPSASKWGTIQVDDFTLATDFDGVFAGGDAVLGPATAVEAVAHGRKAAETIERYLHAGISAQFPWIKPRALDTAFDPMAAPSDTARCEAIKRDPQERRHCFDEVELSLSAADARLEAARCLRCDFGKVFVSRGGEP